MSSLQCPATLLLVGPARDDEPPGPAEQVAGQVAGRRVAHVWSGGAAQARRTATALAERLGVGTSELSGLDEEGPDEDGPEAVTRLREALGEIADAHPGETALVVAHPDVLRRAVPVLTRMEATPAALGAGTVVEVAIDADDWVCRAWS